MTELRWLEHFFAVVGLGFTLLVVGMTVHIFWLDQKRGRGQKK